MLENNPLGHEAHVRRLFDPRSVEIWVQDRQGRVKTTDGWREPETDSWAPPSLRLDPETAQNLWVQLTRELGLDVALPSTDQRADYLHERERVDQLLAHVMARS